MAKYHGLITDAGTTFEVGKISIEEISDEVVQGKKTGYLQILKKGKNVSQVSEPAAKKGKKPKKPGDPRPVKEGVLYARVHVAKVDTFLYSK